MLKQRIITASILMFVFVGALLFTPWSIFITLVSGVFLVGLWEWSDLSSLKGLPRRVLFLLGASVAGIALALWTDWARDNSNLKMVLVLACAWWALALLWVQSFPASAVLWRSRVVRMAMGLLVLLPSWLAVAYLRSRDDGVLIVLMCLCIVAAADIGAYFTGRKFGRRKLAPDVSPGKSWEGVWGGMVFALVLGGGFGYFIVGVSNWLALVMIIIPTALISVVGDLVESMLKRNRGIKDSGTILPGHGGILDRIDGLVAALPVFSLALLSAQV